MSQFFLRLIFTLMAFFATSTTALAAGEFSTTFHSDYTISLSGETSVVHTISLKNNTSHIYATNYTLATSGNNLRHLTTTDEYGSLSSTSTVQNGITTIHLQIDNPKIGLGQVKTLTLAYQTDDVVEQIGNTITINIPRLAKANEAENYTRVVRVEGVEDLPQYVYPEPDQYELDHRYAHYTFEGHQNDSLTLLFGESVTYSLSLQYELINKELSSGITELALPPDTAYQQVVITDITPAPDHIALDENGNWLARYPLKAQEKIEVSANLLVTVYPVPTLFDPSPHTPYKTTSDKYWNPSSTQIQDLATRLKTPQNFYTYLVDNFTYNYSGVSGGVERLGAVKALFENTSVLCTEFTDSFVSLARAVNIPSRAVLGYGYTSNATLQPQNLGADILHAWPEFFDSQRKQWISVDPTWGNTTGGIDYFNKLDYSHIAFVRLGAEDSYPLPPGSYKSNPSDRFVHVEIAIPDQVEPSYQVVEEKGKEVVINTGPIALVNHPVELEGRVYTVRYLQPFGRYVVGSDEPSSLWTRLTQFFTWLATWANFR